MIFRLIHGGSLGLSKCRRARMKGPAGRIWPAGRSLPTSVLESFLFLNQLQISSAKKTLLKTM